MNRTGIAPGEAAVKLYKQSSLLQGLKVVGLHAYDGHIRNSDLDKRTKECEDAFYPVSCMQNELIKQGLEAVIVAGGSPTFYIHAKRKNIECSPGTFIYWDKGYSISCPEQPFLTAALVLTRIISLPDKTKLCLDLGHKSIASENELNKRIFFLNAPEVTFIGHSEEHLVVEATPDHDYKVGDVFYGLPFHICPTVALYERAHVIEGTEVRGEWKTIARDRKITV
jgi:D-serine deaminase-like pyridoxal phosphate-dependent protein